ncbi:DNA-binding transcription repressor [Coemansia sp. RSA 1843]|nr:DNA-binding transcription repressor [Coemansia sp. RSA 1843]
MATSFNHMAVAPARNKRKGIPMRSPCQRDMIEAPGVVFRFPDKINTPSVNGDHINSETSNVSAIDILPSSAGLPSGLGAKTAAAVIAAAAAVTLSSSDSSDSFNNSTADNTAPTITTTAGTDSGDAIDITAAASATADALTQSKQQEQQQQQQQGEMGQHVQQSAPFSDTTDPGKESSDQDGAAALGSANSTPLLKPTTGPSSISAGAVPIHRSASNVLHYPELLTDLRDKLIQIHQISGHGSNHNSSGIESDGNHHTSAANSSVPRRSRVRRAGRGGASGAFGERETPSRRGRHYYPSVGARRSGLRGGNSQNSRASASSPGADSSNTLDPSSAAAAAAVAKSSGVSFHRRHSIGTIQSQAEDDEEIVDVEDDGDDEDDEDDGPLALASAAPHQYNLPVSYRHSSNNGNHYKHQQARRQHDGQVSGTAASAKRHHPLGNGAVPASGVPSASGKRKRESSGIDRPSKSPSAPQAKRTAHGHQPFHRHQSPAAASIPTSSGSGRRSCASCGANSTPCWRPGLIDKVTLCNQCGLRYKKGKVYCPTCSYVPTKTEIATGGALECKRCMSRIVRQHNRPSSPSTSRASESPTPDL